MKPHIAAIITLSAFITAGCANNNRNEEENFRSTTHIRPKLEIPQIPTAIKDARERGKYLIKSYWVNYNFNDTTLLDSSSYTASPLFSYLDLVKELKDGESKALFSSFIETLLKSAPKTREKFLSLIEYNYYHPDSPIKDEELYEMVIDSALSAAVIPVAERERYKFQKNLIGQNRVGNIANNIIIKDLTGKTISLRSVDSKFTVLLLFDPDCGHCRETIERMKVSPVLKSEKVKIFAVLAENSSTRFKRGLADLDSDWISGYDFREEIMNNQLYDLRPSPSLYLLDSGKRVLIKDGALHDIEAYLASKI